MDTGMRVIIGERLKSVNEVREMKVEHAYH